MVLGESLPLRQVGLLDAQQTQLHIVSITGGDSDGNRMLMENAMLKYSDGIHEVSESAIIGLYDSVGWSNYTDKPDELMKALANSTYIVSCFDDEQLVGLARSISDDSAIHYLQDILVNPAYHQRGIGRELFNRCLRRFDHVRSHVLLTDDEERQRLFYQSLGFHNTREVKKVALNCYVKMKGMTLE